VEKEKQKNMYSRECEVKNGRTLTEKEIDFAITFKNADTKRKR